MEASQTILEMKYARIIEAIAKMRSIAVEQAMEMFYNSKTFNLINEGVADLHCRSELYLAEEVLLEYENNEVK